MRGDALHHDRRQQRRAALELASKQQCKLEPALYDAGLLPQAFIALGPNKMDYVLRNMKTTHMSAALLGAIACTILGLVFGVLHEHDEVHEVLAKDIGVLGVIVGTSILVDVSGKSGLFQFLAVKIAKRAQGDPQKLFTLLIALTVVFVSLLTIAPGTLIVVSLGIVLCRTLKLEPKPFLVGIAISANSGALVTFASGICTLMVGSAANLPYMHFFIVSTPMAIATAVVAWFFFFAPAPAAELPCATRGGGSARKSGR